MQLDKFTRARETLAPILRDTKLIFSDSFSEHHHNRVYLKPENLQMTGSYKIRGAFCKISSLPEEARKKGIITSSAGNHAQGVAYAAQVAGVRATIVMPSTTPLVKINNTKKYGAKVVLEGGYYDEAYEAACAIGRKEGLEFIHPFNDLEIATGQGTMAFEILRDLPETDVIIVPIGGGGLAAGVATLAKLLKPAVTIVGVEPEGAACMLASLQKGAVASLGCVSTIADGVAVATPGDKVFPFVQANVDEIITVSDQEIPHAFLEMMENHKMIVENAGLLPVAALKKLRKHGKNVVAVLSGGNMDVITMSSLVQHGLIARGRVFTFSVLLPDRPGELVKVAQVVAGKRGNIIRLDHNQFVNINRNAAVELLVTLEAYGHEHQAEIIQALRASGYEPTVSLPRSIY